MSFWDRFIKKQAKNIWGGAPSYLQAPERDTTGYLDAYGQIYTLFGVSLRIATAVSEVKWRLYKGDERSERSQVADHPILRLLDHANDFQTGEEIIELLQLHMDLAGKGYLYFPRNGFGVPGEMWVLPPNKMQIVKSGSKFIAGYILSVGNEKIPFSTDEVIRFPMPDPVNPYGGVGYAQATAVELDSELYAGQWNRNFFYNSARADAYIKADSELSTEQYDRIKEQWQSRHGGLAGAHKIAILEGGLEYKQIQISPKDMDFYNLRKQTRESLLFAFGMPLSVMGISENVNRANAEAGDYTFARWLIKPRLTRIKNKLNEQLMPMFPKATGVELDFDEIVPETIEQKTRVSESAVKTGIMTINEGRKMHGLDPVSSGDVFLIPFNMMPTPANKPIKPPPSAPPPAPKSFNEAQKETFWKVYVTKAENYERLLIKSIRDMFDGQEIEALRKLGSKPRRGMPLIDKRRARTAYKDATKSILRDLIDHSVDDALELIEPKPEHRSKDAESQSQAWLNTRIGWAAEEISDETARLLSVQLSQGIEAGESVPAIARRIHNTFDMFNRSRALKIARTETIMASNEGALYGYADSRVVEKAEFYAALDERTCEDCMGLHGIVEKLDEAHGMIPVHPNCRCVWLPVV